MLQFDVVVVGAGPAGNMAAYELAKGGARVALLEKQALPRRKTCGGGMPVSVSKLLKAADADDLDPAAFVECSAQYMRHTWKFEDAVMAPVNAEDDETDLSLWMVQRSVFDYALAQRAAAAGASLCDSLAVRSVECERGRRLRVSATRAGAAWEAEADYVIGADGANGVVARSVGLRSERALAIAIEAEVPHRWGDGHPDLRPDVCHLEYGAVNRGYAWIFPKRDHLNVGAGVFRPRQADGRGNSVVRLELQNAISGYLAAMGVPKPLDELPLYAHPLPIWNGMDRIQSRDGRVMLAGDSAGLVNPFFGDGILNALKSGGIAARAILSGSAKSYTAAIRAELGADMNGALKVAQFFYQWPSFCYRHGVKRPTATRTAARLLSGDGGFNDASKRVIKRVREAMRAEAKQGLLDVEVLSGHE